MGILWYFFSFLGRRGGATMGTPCVPHINTYFSVHLSLYPRRYSPTHPVPLPFNHHNPPPPPPSTPLQPNPFPISFVSAHPPPSSPPWGILLVLFLWASLTVNPVHGASVHRVRASNSLKLTPKAFGLISSLLPRVAAAELSPRLLVRLCQAWRRFVLTAALCT